MSLAVTWGTYTVTRSLRVVEESSPVHVALQDFFRRDDNDLDNNDGKDDENNQQAIHQVHYPVENPIPNPVPADGNSTFSACMLVMDDNHRLIEWMAYHYHVLPLRYMIVAVDPRSKTSPTFLFNRWRRRGVYIEEWGDKNFWVERKPIHDHTPFQEKRDRHRGRQKFFYKQCLIRLKEANRTWVALHDSDEFLVYNHVGGDAQKLKEHQEKARISMLNYKKGKTYLLEPSQVPPTTAEAGAMIHYIRQEQKAGLEYYQSPCIGIPRLMFGATESPDFERTKNVPDGWKDFVPQLDTLRFRTHAQRNNFVKNALGKVMMDVSRIDVANAPYFMSLHRPIKAICSAPWHNDWESGLRINHYLGSWDSYSFRDDARRGGERSREQWEYKAAINSDETDDNIRPWLRGFVETEGQETAQSLLQGAGLPKNYRNRNGSAWTLLPDKLNAIIRKNESTTNDAKLLHFENWVRQKYKN